MNFDWVDSGNTWWAFYNEDMLYLQRREGFPWRWRFRSKRRDARWQDLPDTVTTFDEAAAMVAVLVRMEES